MGILGDSFDNPSNREQWQSERGQEGKKDRQREREKEKEKERGNK